MTIFFNVLGSTLIVVIVYVIWCSMYKFTTGHISDPEPETDPLVDKAYKNRELPTEVDLPNVKE